MLHKCVSRSSWARIFPFQSSHRVRVKQHHKCVSQIIQRVELKNPSPRSCSPSKCHQFLSAKLVPKVRDEGEKLHAIREGKM